jgi:rhodanese-related sulfurtransferase
MNTSAIELLSCEEVKGLLDEGTVGLVDVREPDEYEYEHIPGARSVPLGNCEELLSSSDLPEKLVLQCQSGNRSAQAVRKLLQSNPRVRLYSLDGGLSEWKKKGYQTERGRGAVLPIMRQVQIGAGSFVLLGVALSLFVSSYFWVVPAFVGAGLVFAGVTGFCGLARVLQVMPWNRACESKTCNKLKGCQ